MSISCADKNTKMWRQQELKSDGDGAVGYPCCCTQKLQDRWSYTLINIGGCKYEGDYQPVIFMEFHKDPY